MKALCLGAGYGTRLYPLTKDRPKPLLPVGGRPILERILERILPIPEVDEIYVVSNHRFAAAYETWAKRYRCPPDRKIRIFDDGTLTNEDRLGAVGDLQFVLEQSKLDDDFLVVAGDNLLDFDLRDFVAFARPRGNAIGLKDMKDRSLISRYSVVEVDRDRKVVHFEEKPPYPRTTLISLGVYFFPRGDLGLMRRYLDSGGSPDAPGYYIQWLYKQVPVFGYVTEGTWFDIGDIDSYNRANELYGGG